MVEILVLLGLFALAVVVSMTWDWLTGSSGSGGETSSSPSSSSRDNFGPKSIGNVVENGAFITAYDEDGKRIFSIQKGSGPNDGLVGYTSTQVNLRNGAVAETYDTKGRFLRFKQVR